MEQADTNIAMVTVFPLLCDEQGGPPCCFLRHLTQNMPSQPPQLFSCVPADGYFTCNFTNLFTGCNVSTIYASI